MTRDILDINDYIVLLEASDPAEETIDRCTFEDEIIAVAFYGEGNVDLEVRYQDKHKTYSHTKGMTLAFYATEEVEFVHNISLKKSLRSILIATSLNNLEKLPNQEGEIFSELLYTLTHPS
ncbi:MAG: AraC family transcriptional regulator, partial [Bacteroidota bacterium]